MAHVLVYLHVCCSGATASVPCLRARLQLKPSISNAFSQGASMSALQRCFVRIFWTSWTRFRHSTYARDSFSGCIPRPYSLSDPALQVDDLAIFAGLYPSCMQHGSSSSYPCYTVGCCMLSAFYGSRPPEQRRSTLTYFFSAIRHRIHPFSLPLCIFPLIETYTRNFQSFNPAICISGIRNFQSCQFHRIAKFRKPHTSR
ncbi:hypothetical protein B0H14DRAFT_2921319, partial [Mycena olivaceomarginata]